MTKSIIVIITLFALLIGCDTEKKELQNDSLISKIENWARPGTQGQMSGAYFVYINELSIADTLLSVESPNADMTQIHESYTTDDGLSGMREMKEIIVQPNKKLILQKGGLHVMLMNLKQDLSAEDSINISLTFSQAGNVNFTLPVLAEN